MGKKIIGKSIMALPAPFNAGSSNPIDTRFVVETLADLTTPDTFGTEGKYCFVYEGLPVYVSSEKATYTYMGPVAEGEGVLSEEVAKSENWVKNTNALELQNELKNIKFGIFGTKEDINFEKDFAVEMNDGSIYIVKDIDWNKMGTVWEGLKCVAFCFTTPFSDDLWYSEYYPKFNKVISLGDTTVLNNRIFLYGYFSNPDVYKNVISSDGHPMILLGGENNRELNFPLCGFNLSELGNRLYGFSIPPKTTLTFNHNVAYNSRLTEFNAWGVGGDKEILYEINITDPTVHNLFENCELPDLRRIKINRTIDPNTNYEDFKGCTFTRLPTNREGGWENYAWTKDLVKCAFTRGMQHNPVWGENYVADFTVFDFSKLEDASGFITECTLRGIKIAFPNLKSCSWGYLTSELKTIIISELGTLEKGCAHFLLGGPQNCLESLTINMENVTNTGNMFYHDKNTPGFAKCTYLHLEKLKTGIDISGFMNCSLESIKFIFDSALDVTASPLTLTIYKGLYDLIPALWIKDFKAKGWNLSSRTADYLDRLFSYGAFTKLESELLIYFTHKALALKWENNIIQLINTVDETVISELDGSEFIKDGMLNDVEVVGNDLVFTFNTDSGKQAIRVSLGQFVTTFTAGKGITITDNTISLTDEPFTAEEKEKLSHIELTDDNLISASSLALGGETGTTILSEAESTVSSPISKIRLSNLNGKLFVNEGTYRVYDGSRDISSIANNLVIEKGLAKALEPYAKTADIPTIPSDIVKLSDYDGSGDFDDLFAYGSIVPRVNSDNKLSINLGTYAGAPSHKNVSSADNPVTIVLSSYENRLSAGTALNIYEGNRDLTATAQNLVLEKGLYEVLQNYATENSIELTDIQNASSPILSTGTYNVTNESLIIGKLFVLLDSNNYGWFVAIGYLEVDNTGMLIHLSDVSNVISGNLEFSSTKYNWIVSFSPNSFLDTLSMMVDSKLEEVNTDLTDIKDSISMHRDDINTLTNSINEIDKNLSVYNIGTVEWSSIQDGSTATILPDTTITTPLIALTIKFSDSHSADMVCTRDKLVIDNGGEFVSAIYKGPEIQQGVVNEGTAISHLQITSSTSGIGISLQS